MANEVKKGRFCLEFPRGIYAPEAVRLAVHVFDERCAAKVVPGGDSTKVVFAGQEAPGALAGELANEVLNQQCRIDLAKKNSKIAGIILARAFLSACGEKGKRRTGGRK